MKKAISLLALFILFSVEMQAQVTNVLNNFYSVWVKPAIPIIGGLVLIVGALMNMGKVIHNESRDVKGFLSGIVLYLAVYFCLVGIVSYIMAS
jgi:amino acid permease